MITDLNPMNSYYINEFKVNLLMNVRGNLSFEKEKMLNIIDKYLSMHPRDKLNFEIGRRLDIYYCMDDIRDKEKYNKVEQYIESLNESKAYNVDYAKVCNYFRAHIF